MGPWVIVSPLAKYDMPLDSWISGSCLCWFCFALAGSAISGSPLVQNDISYCFGIEKTAIVAVFLEKLWFFFHNFLPLLSVYPRCWLKTIAVWLQWQCPRGLAQLLLLTLLHYASSEDFLQSKQNQTRVTVKAARRKLVNTKPISTLLTKISPVSYPFRRIPKVFC